MVHPERLYHYRSPALPRGPVVYWMQRDQRVKDNFALLMAQEVSLKANQPLIVVFVLAPAFLDAPYRSYAFMLKGLMETEKELHDRNIGFSLLEGNPEIMIPSFVASLAAGYLVTDFNPLRLVLRWKEMVAQRISIPFTEVDTHNIIPCRMISGKQEFSAFTLRRKVSGVLADYLNEIPVLATHPVLPDSAMLVKHCWDDIEKGLRADRSVGAVSEFIPGESASAAALHAFIQNRLKSYAADRNNPVINGQSGLSPWLHFGQLSAQRVALEAIRSGAEGESLHAFLEELIVRRELSDNFCLYNPAYDTFDGFHPWAKRTLNAHRGDPRQFMYGRDIFENASTHDPLWNAAQTEMVRTGKMHGFMRMYWAKKILEWTASPEEAMEVAIFLNDRYSIDGRDPNGYAGIAWSIGGVHDRPWGERQVFGQIRYMNDKGCRRKFDTGLYIARFRTE